MQTSAIAAAVSTIVLSGCGGGFPGESFSADGIEVDRRARRARGIAHRRTTSVEELQCTGNRETWHSLYGDCSAYAEGVLTEDEFLWKHCDDKSVEGDKLPAHQVCAECGDCVDPNFVNKEGKYMCTGHRLTWESEYGGCDDYAAGVLTGDEYLHEHCWDEDDIIYGQAKWVCSECDECYDVHEPCVGSRDDWHSDYGSCSDYEYGVKGLYEHCHDPNEDGVPALRACRECGMCTDETAWSPSSGPM